jgi:hypothetical protein
MIRVHAIDSPRNRWVFHCCGSKVKNYEKGRPNRKILCNLLRRGLISLQFTLKTLSVFTPLIRPKYRGAFHSCGSKMPICEKAASNTENILQLASAGG